MKTQEKRIKELEAEVKHWQSNHADLANRLRIATQRPDLPADRISAIQELQRMQEEIKSLRKQLDLPEHSNKTPTDLTDWLVGTDITKSPEYALIRSHYGDKCAERSGVPLMNHINEGLLVLAAVGGSEIAMRAFCLHPLLQDGKELAKNFVKVQSALSIITSGAMTLGLAMEYRSVANEYLSHCKMPETGIRLSPLKEVNDMLIADKVQNRKDFEIYHAETHENRERLAQYFQEWCDALGVSGKYKQLRQLIIDSEINKVIMERIVL